MTAREIVDGMIDQRGADGAFLEGDLWSAFLNETGLMATPCPINNEEALVVYRDWELRQSGVI